MSTLQSRTSTKHISFFKQSDLPTAANRAPRAGQTANCFNPSSMILQGGQDTGVACGACTQARAISGRPGFCVKQGRLQGSGLPGDTKHKDPVRDTHRMKRTVLSQGCISIRNNDSHTCYIRRPLWGHQACGMVLLSFLPPPVVLPQPPGNYHFVPAGLTRSSLRLRGERGPELPPSPWGGGARKVEVDSGPENNLNLLQAFRHPRN